MNKRLYISLICSFSSISFAEKTHKMIAECQFDYDDFNFCTKENLSKYRQALASRKNNFDSSKILLNVGTLQDMRFVAIDTQSGVVFPLSDTISGYIDEHQDKKIKPPIIQYSLRSKVLCVEGRLYAYRDAYEHAKVCYSIQDNPYARFKKEFSRVATPIELQ